MNLMGKILTLLIFFLSICFLVIAVMVGAAHQNWQEQANENKVVAERAQSLLDQARNREEVPPRESRRGPRATAPDRASRP